MNFEILRLLVSYVVVDGDRGEDVDGDEVRVLLDDAVKELIAALADGGDE